MSENGEIYTAGKNFTLPLAVTAWTNSTSDYNIMFHTKQGWHFLTYIGKDPISLSDSDRLRITSHSVFAMQPLRIAMPESAAVGSKVVVV